MSLVVDGSDTFVLGMDSFTLPTQLQNGEYEIGMNLINRGGIAQTRPGSKSLFDLPGGKLQGCTFFQPSSGAPHLVFAVGGKIYASPAPFKTYFQLSGLQFGTTSKYVAWASCVQSTFYDSFGNLEFLDAPRSVLIIQDGATRAGYWDGSTAAHINPTPSGSDITQTDRDGTPVGLWMTWSNNRLWVSRGRNVFASDAGNPLKFTESQYLNEGRAFYLPGECTGIVETPDQKGIICFTSESGDYIQSSIQNRELWLQTPDFQRTVLPNIGCIAPRSIVQQYGLLWWMTSKGLVSLDSALQANITSRLSVQDNEMFQSKFGLATDLSLACGGSVENFLFHAVPYGEKLNSRVHVLDQAPFEEQVNAWPSYWEGWRPVEFARGLVRSQERVFCLSNDYDGVGRMWELFRSEKTDNGIPITSYLITRQHLFNSRDWKRFKYAEIELRNIVGPTAVLVGVAGLKGSFQPALTKDISSLEGQIYYDSEYGFEAEVLNGSRPQTRIIRTQEIAEPSECNSACVESNERGLIDKAFSLIIAWSGIAGVTAYRIFVQNEDRAYDGTCELDETDENRLLTPQGCGVVGLFSTAQPFEQYEATQSYSDDGYSVEVTENSYISEEDAERKALATAKWYVQSHLGNVD